MEEATNSGSLLPDEFWAQGNLKMEHLVEGEELENCLPFYRFSIDIQRKGREACWTALELNLHQLP